MRAGPLSILVGSPSVIDLFGMTLTSSGLRYQMFCCRSNYIGRLNNYHMLGALDKKQLQNQTY
jgi:hypothetical protein